MECQVEKCMNSVLQPIPRSHHSFLGSRISMLLRMHFLMTGLQGSNHSFDWSAVLEKPILSHGGNTGETGEIFKKE